MTQRIQIICEGIKPLILHRYTLHELLSMWDGSLPLREHSDATIYYDPETGDPAIPRAIIQAVLTRAAKTIGLDLTEKRRLIPGLRLVERFSPIVTRDGAPADFEVDARTGNGARSFRSLESISCILPRFDRWRFTVKAELGATLDWRVARRIFDTAAQLGIGDGNPRLGQFTIQAWDAVRQSRRSMREQLAP